MDKNTITAILLSFLLVFLYMRFYGPKSKKQEKPAATNTLVHAQTSGDKNAPLPAEKPDSTISAKPVSSSGIDEVNNFLSNDLITYSFSSFGGDISEIKVHRSSVVKRGPIITTIAASNDWEVPLCIRNFGNLDVNDVVFVLEIVPSLDLR